MKSSKYNIIIQPEDKVRQEVVLYNTFHDHRLVIENPDHQALEFFNKIKEGLPLSKDDEDMAGLFYEMGIFLDDDVDENKMFDHWYDDKIKKPKGLLNLILVMSMSCNLRCTYCYEKDQLDNSRHLSPETARQFLDWVTREIHKRPIEELHIVFFGGEPLMNKQVLFLVSSQLKRLCERLGISYHGKMVTNGVLMLPLVAQEMRRVGISKVKVTLDGDQQSHDQSRFTISGGKTFDRIWYNLEHANDNLQAGETPIRFLIGGNFQATNYQRFFPLLKQLSQASFAKFIDEISLKPVQEISVADKKNLSTNPCDKVAFDDANIVRMMNLRTEISRRNLTPVDGLDFGPCDYYRGDSMTIGLDGIIYPCIAFVDNPSFAIGHIDPDQVVDEHDKRRQQLEETKSWTDHCYDCAFLPVCTGGCRATAYTHGFDVSSPVCEKKYFKTIVQVTALEMMAQKTTSDHLDESWHFRNLADLNTSFHFEEDEGPEVFDFLKPEALHYFINKGL